MAKMYSYLCSKCYRISSYDSPTLKHYNCARCHGENTLELVEDK